MAIPSVVLVLLLVVSTTTAVEKCPPWFQWVNMSTCTSYGYCVCDTPIPESVVCDQRNQKSSIRLAFCVFYDSEKDHIVGSECSFIFPESVIKDNVIPLPTDVGELNTFVCGNLSREVKGPLCGRCTKDTGPSIYSFGSECVPCSPVNVVYYILLQYLPTTLLFIVVLLFRVNVTAAPMAHYVLFCNLLVFYAKFALPLYTRMYGVGSPFVMKSAITLNAVWSLDALFFLSPPLCISTHMEDIYKPFLEFVATLYPFILLLMTYVAIELHARGFTPIVVLCRPFHRVYVCIYRTWEPNASIIQAFSSLFFLSYAKLNFLIMVAFVPSPIFTTDGHVERHMVFIDPTIPFFATKHIPLIIFSAFIALFLYFPPLLLLVTHPTVLYKKISHRIKPKWNIRFKTFVDTFQGCLKDGTNGSWDYRALSGYSLALLGCGPLLIRDTITVFRGLYTVDYDNTQQYVTIILLGILTTLCSLAQPYKHWAANVSAVATLTLLTAMLALSTGVNTPLENEAARMMLLVLVIIPHCVLGGFVVWKIITTCRDRCRDEEDGEREMLLPNNAP